MAYHPEDIADICATCGREQEPGARFCPNCGAAADPLTGGGPGYAPGMANPSGPMYGGMQTVVPNHLAWAIIVTVLGGLALCCYGVGIFSLVPGIVAIVYATQVNNRLAAGDYNGAVNASNNAKTWCWVATGAYVLVIIGAVLLVTLVGFAAILGGLG